MNSCVAIGEKKAYVIMGDQLDILCKTWDEKIHKMLSRNYALTNEIFYKVFHLSPELTKEKRMKVLHEVYGESILENKEYLDKLQLVCDEANEKYEHHLEFATWVSENFPECTIVEVKQILYFEN